MTRLFLLDGYISIVRIDGNDEVLADWHPPRFSERWKTAAEAQREAVEHVARLIDRGVPGAVAVQDALAT
ncbi:DUF6566 family protein [Burkholderia plantarii]|uniref:DUF6566 family protein n=1 Tax=Burkholderia plantarii TaxID=41899 RepID=UPI001F5BE504|nr:DUF6566 family protein [Burkholderia plantarii]